MRNVYIEARPKGRGDHEPITHYVAEDDAGQVLGVFDSQVAAIDWARKRGYVALLARIRQLNDKKVPHYWRSV